MQNSLTPSAEREPSLPIIPVPVDGVEEVTRRMEAPARAWIEAHRFMPKAGRHLVLPGRDGRPAAVLFGVGAGAQDCPPFLLGKLAGALPPADYRLEGSFGEPLLVALGWALSAYRFERYKTNPAPLPRLVIPQGADEAELRRIVAGTQLARDLVNLPANDLGPAELADAAASLAREFGAAVSVREGETLEQGFPMIHAVGRASARGPRLVDFSWGEAAAPKVTVVGKGVCYDTGGLDIKPSSAMAIMKKDMGGAAAALGLARMVMDARLKLRLRVLIPIVENAISGASFRTGDVLRSRKGLTVEVGNTDAEGRLILADALALADEEEPELLVDLATLTGAARVALGPDLPPFYTDDETLAADLARHSSAVADPVWRMPLWPAYESMLEGKIADISSTGSSPMAGSVTAALFLKRFVERARAWAHFDIYAWNPSAKPARPEGGEAQAIRTLYALLRERYGAA